VTGTIRGLELSPLETAAVLGSVALVLARWLRPGARRPVAIVAAAVVVAAGIALMVSGVRWQLVPVLAAAIAALPFAVAPLPRRRSGRPVWRAPWWLALPASVACIGLVAAGVTAALAFPVPVFPTPSGPFAVGTTVVEWVDPDRAEDNTAEPRDRRAVVVQLWYPAQKPSPQARPAQYLGRTRREARTVATALAEYVGIPGFLVDGLPRAHSHSVPHAPVVGGGTRFPVVLFSPGLGGVRTQNTAWAEDLASRGYVVAGLDHPYDSAAVVFADGRTIRTRVAATGNQDTDNKRAVGWTAVRAQDLSFVLTQLGRLDRGEITGPLTGRLDTGRAAATGHSLGGAAALRAARQDHRFTAVIDLDGYPYDPDPQPLPQPVLALTQPFDQRNAAYVDRLTQVLRLSTATSYRLAVPDSGHLTFTDAPLYLPPVPGLVGSLGRTEGPRLTAATTAAFLDTALRGEPRELPALLSRYGNLTVYGPGG
jgi:predicted dienelactone hydrolase